MLAVFTTEEYRLWAMGNAEPAIYYGSISYGSMVAIPITKPGNYTVVIYPIPSLQYTPQLYINIYNELALPIGAASLPLSSITTSEIRSYFDIASIKAYTKR
jgi:hypothetical protein